MWVCLVPAVDPYETVVVVCLEVQNVTIFKPTVQTKHQSQLAIHWYTYGGLYRPSTPNAQNWMLFNSLYSNTPTNPNVWFSTSWNVTNAQTRHDKKACESILCKGWDEYLCWSVCKVRNQRRIRLDAVQQKIRHHQSHKSPIQSIHL